MPSAINPASQPSPATVALKRVLRISKLNGWSIVIIAGLGALGSILFHDLVGIVVCLLSVGAGLMELHGNRMLKRHDSGGMAWLFRAELFLLGVIAAYLVSRLASFDQESVLGNLTPEMQSSLTQMGVETKDLVRLVRMAFYGGYGGALLLTLIYQGGMALYYLRKVPLVTEATSVRTKSVAWDKPPPLPPPTPPVYSLRKPGTQPAQNGGAGGFFPQDIIAKKRDGGALTREELEFFVRGVVDGKFTDYQATALLMAIYWRGMSTQETAWLTDLMVRSGEVIDLGDLPGYKIDKHSTGGVGDKVSLILAPLAAACGLKVPMMSGRGLGHTGGTLDKLEAIPGFRVKLGVPEFMLVLERVGCAMIGQTAQVAPADRKLYALRDVTGTVESIPLICSSIMSKKIAEGINSLVLDVKFGKGAFMKSKAQARELAESMVAIGRLSNKPVRALLTTMDQPLGRAVGHTTEVIEAIACLKGTGPADLMEVTIALTSHMLLLGGIARSEDEARKRIKATLDSGLALQKFRDLCVAQGGNAQAVDNPALLPTARLCTDIRAALDARGFVAEVDALKVGQAVMLLGGGRATVNDRIDHAVGLSNLVKIGEPVNPGARLFTLHANDEAKAVRAEALLREAITFAETPPAPVPLVQDLIQ